MDHRVEIGRLVPDLVAGQPRPDGIAASDNKSIVTASAPSPGAEIEGRVGPAAWWVDPAARPRFAEVDCHPRPDPRARLRERAIAEGAGRRPAHRRRRRCRRGHVLGPTAGRARRTARAIRNSRSRSRSRSRSAAASSSTAARARRATRPCRRSSRGRPAFLPDVCRANLMSDSRPVRHAASPNLGHD